jgi:aspartate aminotransferase
MYCVNDLFAAVCGAGRALGYVCASSLFQKLVERCIGTGANIAVYSKNRELLYGALSEYGFDCIHPEGAFYLFVKAPEGNAEKFAQAAKKHELLIVPADSFGAPDCVRISYCVSTEQIMRSLPAFKALAEEIKAK